MSNIQKKGPQGFQQGRAVNPSFIMNALVEELNKPFVPRRDDEEVYDPNLTFMDMVIQKCVQQAAYGDRHARKEIFDRIDGKPVQQLSIAQIVIFINENRDLVRSLLKDYDIDAKAD